MEWTTAEALRPPLQPVPRGLKNLTAQTLLLPNRETCVILCWGLNQHAPEEVDSAGKDGWLEKWQGPSATSLEPLNINSAPKGTGKDWSLVCLPNLTAELSPCCPLNK